jgi:nucleotide-binding universal stress UspA family protein
MYSSIVVGYDDSLYSKAALAEVAQRVKKNGGSVTLVHAVFFDKEEFAVMPSQLEQRMDIGARLCRVAKTDLQSAYGLNGSVESFVCEGEPPEVIVDTARGKKADLIALGTYGRRGLKRLLMGSVTSQVILNATCDVLVVKKPCIGGSISSEKALLRAAALAKTDGAEISVLYVIPRYEEMMDFFKTETIKKSLYQEAEKIVGGAKKLASGLGLSIKAVVQEGRAGDKIVEIADTMKHDLIVVGTHGWSGMDKAIMGSTAERVIANASCPILIVK